MKKFNSQEIDMKNSGNRGFTLVEMLVTCTILGIILTLSVRGLLSWQDWTRYTRANEYAETLFVAAQNQLSEYSSDGTLSQFDESIKYGGVYQYVVDISSSDENTRVIDADGGQYTLTGVWKESQSEDEGNARLYQGDICYLIAYQGDYQIYKAGGSPKGPGAAQIFELLGDYVYDKSILDESICVEFSPESGQIFAVSYSDNATGFEYNNENINTKGILNVANRTEEFRRSRYIGYYGVDTLTLATSSNKKKPKLTEVKLNNEDTLNLSFDVGKVKAAKQRLVYDIELSNADTDELLLKFTLDGSKLEPRHDDSNKTGNTVSCPVTVYLTDELSGDVAEKTDDYDFPAWIEEDGTVRVVLDAADLQATSELYEREADKILSADATGNMLPEFANTYSLHRFGVSAKKISCSVQGYSDMYITTSRVKAKGECSPYFADSSTVAEEVRNADGTPVSYAVFDYDIENARHLYNVRFEEDVKTATFRGMNENIADSDSLEINYRLLGDIDWTEFTDGMNFYNSWSGEMAAGGIDFSEDSGFPSFKTLRNNDTFDGGEYTINGLSMSEDLNALSGIYGNEDKGPTGLFVENKGMLSNLKLDNVAVAGSDNVAAFVGSNNGGRLSKLVTLNSENKSLISGKTCVGGIVGAEAGLTDDTLYRDDYGKSKDSPVLIENMENNARVEGTRYVGGVVGKLKLTKDLYVLVSECKNYGVVAANEEKEKAAYIGGIAGYCSNLYEENGKRDAERLVISGCVSSPQYAEDELVAKLENGSISEDEKNSLLDEKANGVYVGGIVGYNNCGSIVSCSTEEKDDAKGYVFGYMYVGGIAGFNMAEENTLTGGTDGEKGINYADVIGDCYVGGIVGCNAQAEEENPDDSLDDDLDADNSDESAALNNADATEPIAIKKDKNINLKIENWENRGNVYARTEYSGGIAGGNTGTISNAENTGSVSSKDGGAGGIAGENTGVISSCRVNPKDETEGIELDYQNKLEITAGYRAGGIAALNGEGGEITDCSVSNVRLGNNTDKAGLTGAVAGENAGTVTLSSGRCVFGCVAESSSNDTAVGGVAGSNSGIIQGAEWRAQGKSPYTFVSCDIGFKDNAETGNLGGAAGVNTGIIKNLAVVANISANMGSEKTGCGGIAGISGSFTKPADNTEMGIFNCTYNGNLTASGSVDKIICAGGIVGQNLFGSTVEFCRLGALLDGISDDEQKTFINVYNLASPVKDYSGSDAGRYGGKIYDYSKAYGYIGGIAGANAGTVRSCDNYDLSAGAALTQNVRIYTGAGCIGGIVGYNKENGVVTGTKDAPLSTGSWDILSHAYENNDGYGGIVGYTASSAGILYAYNYARVSNTGSYPETGIAVAGIAGRIENKSADETHVEHCANYADISGQAENAVTDYAGGVFGYANSNSTVCGGIVSVIMQGGAVISDCENYGNVGTVTSDCTPAGDYAAGIIAVVSGGNTAEISIENCNNYGSIYSAGYGSGIIAKAANTEIIDDVAQLHITSCINAGSLYVGNVSTSSAVTEISSSDENESETETTTETEQTTEQTTEQVTEQATTEQEPATEQAATTEQTTEADQAAELNKSPDAGQSTDEGSETTAAEK